MAAGRVGRRKLNRMETGPYQRALINRGVTMKVDAEDEKVPVLQQAMEYTGAVGTGGKCIYNQWIHCDLIVIF